MTSDSVSESPIGSEWIDGSVAVEDGGPSGFGLGSNFSPGMLSLILMRLRGGDGEASPGAMGCAWPGNGEEENVVPSMIEENE